MKEDFITFFSLENAYVVNHFIHSLHRLPLIKKIVEGKSYDAKGLKVLGSIYRIFREISMMIFFKLLYYALIVGMASIVIDEMGIGENTERSALGLVFFTIFVFATLSGALFNNKLFDTGEHSYYAVTLLRVDARNYALINYGYTNLKHFVFNLLAGLILSLVFGLPVYLGLLLPLFVIGVKLTFQGLNLLCIDFFHKHQSVDSWVKIILTLIYAAALALLLITGHVFNLTVIITVFTGFILLGAATLIFILSFKDYQRVYKKEMSLARNVVETKAQTVKAKEQNIAKNALSEKTITASSNKTGFAYLNDLFMKRHHKSLWGTVRIQLIVIAVVFAIITGVLLFVPDGKEGFADFITEWITAIMFLMYCLNRGQSYTTCLFVNCDHCFLTYPFFKEPKLILRFFGLRLFSLIKLNILPGLLIGAGLDWVFFLSSGSTEILNYFVLFVSPVAMAVFFSIHYMMLYYILQPFTVDAEIASVPYKVINVITYVVAYMLYQVRLGGFAFGIGAIIFCVLYSAVAVALVYKKAAKTFRIRQ